MIKLNGRVLIYKKRCIICFVILIYISKLSCRAGQWLIIIKQTKSRGSNYYIKVWVFFQKRRVNTTLRLSSTELCHMFSCSADSGQIIKQCYRKCMAPPLQGFLYSLPDGNCVLLGIRIYIWLTYNYFALFSLLNLMIVYPQGKSHWNNHNKYRES